MSVEQDTQHVPTFLYAVKKRYHASLTIGERDRMDIPPDYTVNVEGTAKFVNRIMTAAADAFEEDELR